MTRKRRNVIGIDMIRNNCIDNVHIFDLSCTAMSKSPKQQPKCLKRAETNVILIGFNECPLSYPHLYCLFHKVALHESGTIKALLGS